LQTLERMTAHLCSKEIETFVEEVWADGVRSIDAFRKRGLLRYHPDKLSAATGLKDVGQFIYWEKVFKKLISKHGKGMIFNDVISLLSEIAFADTSIRIMGTCRKCWRLSRGYSIESPTSRLHKLYNSQPSYFVPEQDDIYFPPEEPERDDISTLPDVPEQDDICFPPEEHERDDISALPDVSEQDDICFPPEGPERDDISALPDVSEQDDISALHEEPKRNDIYFPSEEPKRDDIYFPSEEPKLEDVSFPPLEPEIDRKKDYLIPRAKKSKKRKSDHLYPSRAKKSKKRKSDHLDPPKNNKKKKGISPEWVMDLVAEFQKEKGIDNVFPETSERMDGLKTMFMKSLMQSLRSPGIDLADSTQRYYWSEIAKFLRLCTVDFIANKEFYAKVLAHPKNISSNKKTTSAFQQLFILLEIKI
jgi:hypothetical protein